MTDLDILGAALREIKDIADDEMDMDRHDLSAILNICDRVKVRNAMGRAQHTTTITEGGHQSNYTVSCSCGKTWGCATTDPGFADRWIKSWAR